MNEIKGSWSPSMMPTVKTGQIEAVGNGWAPFVDDDEFEFREF